MTFVSGGVTLHGQHPYCSVPWWCAYHSKSFNVSILYCVQVKCSDTPAPSPFITFLSGGVPITQKSLNVPTLFCVQVECFDTPAPSPYMTPLTGGVPVCMSSSISAQASRIILLGESGGMYCCRLMAWQETLRTLQVCVLRVNLEAI